MARVIQFRSGLTSALQTRVGRRVFLLFVTCALLPTCALGAASYISVRNDLREQAFERARQTAKRMGTALFERFEDLRATLAFAADDVVEGTVALSARRVEIDPRFSAVVVQTPLDTRTLRGTLPPRPALSDRQRQHLMTGGTIITISTDSGRAILMARAAGSPASPSIIWVQVADALIDNVLVGEATSPRPGPVCIVLPDGRIVHCRHGAEVDTEGFARALATEATGTFVWESDERQLAGFWSLFLDAQFASPDWRIVHSVPEVEILAPVAAFRKWFAFAAALALLIVGLLSIRLIRRYLQPLAALQEGTERVARLQFDPPVEVTSGDEFEELANAFNGMTARLQGQFDEAERLNKALGRTSEELQERQARLSAILDAAADAIVTLGRDNRIESFNRTAERVFSVGEAQAIGRSLDELFAVPLRMTPTDSSATDAERAPAEAAGRRSDGTVFPAEVRFTQASAGDRIIYTVFIRDISERKRAEEERDRLETQLRHAQKMETIGTLAGGIAHDFNNILTPIIGHVDLALGGDSSTTVKEDLDEVRRAALRAKDLVSQILLFSRRGEKSFGAIEVAGVVKEALKLLRSSLPTTIDIRHRIAPDVAPVLGDATQLHQVLMNLCTNAYHAMREQGGVLDVRLEMIPADARVRTELPGLEGDRLVRLTVRDTGHGMDSVTLERLFEPFFTTKPAGEGTGLGMSIVHGIIARHGGAITVQSSVGVGTTFEILLPPATGPASVPVTTDVATQVKGEGRILVVDDDAVIARLVARMLEQHGYDVVSTTKPLDVLSMLDSAEPPFELVITDHTMPGLTGLHLAHLVQERRPGFPIILLSGYSDFGGRQDPAQLGLRELLTKPVPMDVLAATVARVLTDERRSGRKRE